MKDIDFDELDRAVNSLMEEKRQEDAEASSVDTAPAPQPAPLAATTATEPSLLAAPVQDAPVVSSDAASAIEPVESAVLPPAAPIVAPRRAAGRYMDMVAGAKPAPVLQTHREAAVSRVADRNAQLSGYTISDITPKADTSSEPAIEAMVAESAAEPAVVTPVVEESAAPIFDSRSSVPTAEVDPEVVAQVIEPEQAPEKPQSLDAEMQAKLEEALGISGVPEEETSLAVTPPAEVTTEEEVAPMVSPFIPDAQVEKRPLGQGNPDLKPVTALGLNDTSSAADEDPRFEDNVPAENLPAELRQEVLAVESASGSTAALQGQQSESQTEVVSETIRVADSIPQKPVKSPDMATQDHAPLYDTNVQPLIHPAKKKSGWGVVIIIILLILLGVGGAVAAYLLKLF